MAAATASNTVVCDMCLSTLGLYYDHDINDCPLQSIAVEGFPEAHFQCRLCRSDQDCPIHPCPWCQARHLRSECTSFASLEEPAYSQIIALLNARHRERIAEDADSYCVRANEEHDAELAEQGGLIGALRALGADED